MSGCKIKRAEATPVITKNGKSPSLTEVIFLPEEENQAARYKMKPNFKNYEGWKESGPAMIQREAPPVLSPRPGIKTAAVASKLNPKTTNDHALHFL